MKTHETGRESRLIADVRSGRKTIDVRLAKPRFNKFKVGDRIRPREDIWEGGKIVASRPTDIEVEITKIQRFPSFRAMFKKVGVARVLPQAKDITEAISICRRFYSEEDEKKFGVIAFYFKLV